MGGDQGRAWQPSRNQLGMCSVNVQAHLSSLFLRLGTWTLWCKWSRRTYPMGLSLVAHDLVRHTRTHEIR